MNLPWQNIEGFAGVAGVGALCFLGIFLLLDGQNSELFPTVEIFAKTATWSIVAAIPVISIVYLIGLLATSTSTLAIDQISSMQGYSLTNDLIKISEYDKTTITQIFLQLKHDREILAGSFIGLILLGIGAISETSNLPHLRRVIIIAAIGSFILAFVTLGLGIYMGGEAHLLASALTISP